MALIVQKIVVAFDICSSTLIIEDLHKTENIDRWKDFLIWIKRYLNIKASELSLDIYKFTGDGWILLFDKDFNGDQLISFMKDFCKQFKMRYKIKIEQFLETPPQISGLNFGVASGTLLKFVMNGQTEYIGRSINVACRLQSAIKDRDDFPQYKALIAKPLFHNLDLYLKNKNYKIVRRKLRNLSEGKEIDCVKVLIINDR